LKEVEEEQLELSDALTFVQQVKGMIQELEATLPAGRDVNFRKRLFEYVNHLEQSNVCIDETGTFRLKAGVLLVLFSQRFGVAGLFNRSESNKSTE
jgi:hypothetical protein